MKNKDKPVDVFGHDVIGRNTSVSYKEAEKYHVEIKNDEESSESKLDLAQLEKRLDDALNSETKESLTEWLLKQRKTNKDLVEQIIETLDEYSYVDELGFKHFSESVYREVATEIAKLVPSYNYQITNQNEKMVSIPLWQLKEIEDTLRLASNMYESQKKETCFDRMVCKTWEWCKKLIQSNV